MQVKTIKLISLLLIIVFTSTGCWDSLDINNKNIISMVIFDKKDGVYSFLVEIATITSGGEAEKEGGNSSNTSKHIIVQCYGNTIIEARENLDRQFDKPLYLSSTRTILITERASKTELTEYLMRLRADPTYRQKIHLFTTREEPENFKDSIHGNNSLIGASIDETFQTLIVQGRSFDRPTNRYIENILEGSGFTIPCIGLQDKHIILSGYSIIENGANIGFIPAEESRGMEFIKADAPKLIYQVPFGNNSAAIEVEVIKKKFGPSYENGIISFDMKFDFVATTLYFSQADSMPFTESTKEELTKSLLELLKKELADAVERSQKEFKSDYLLFDDEFRIKFPDEFDRINWAQEYPNIKVTFDVKVDLKPSMDMDFSPS